MKKNRIKKDLALLVILTLFMGLQGYAQSAAVSPSRLYFNANPGETQVRRITITNNSETSQSFTISFADFGSPGTSGKTELLNPGESEHSGSAWLNATPSFVELQSGESRDVEILLQVPGTPDAARVVWATILVRLARERTQPAGLSQTATGFGIMQTFQFVIHVFQTPPSITFKDARILKFEDAGANMDGQRRILLNVENIGEAIIDVAAYLEFTNLGTGHNTRERARAFTILPGHSREVFFILPENLPPGRYSVLGVVDYGDRESVIAAEMDLVF